MGSNYSIDHRCMAGQVVMVDKTPRPLFLADDRSIAVPPGWLPVTGYVPIHKIKMVCRERMAIGDLDRAYQKRLQAGENQPWPCPTGKWDDETFLLHDGRHEYIASLMIGYEYLLVTWLEKQNESS
jgi:hypothetical protein